MARISPLPEGIATPEVRDVYERVKARFGTLVEPVSITANHPEILKAFISYEVCFREASRVQLKMKELATLKVAALIGCPFRMDFGSAEAKRLGITEAQMKDLPVAVFVPENLSPTGS